MLTKFVLPMVVFSQHATQCMYPSKALSGPNERRNLILAHLIPVVGMSFAFACSHTAQANFPAVHQTLLWGGDFDAWPFAMIQTAAFLHSGIVMYVFWILMKEHPIILAVHLLPLWGVISTLWFTEGTLMFGSKWCTYCLIYSAVYICEPLWLPMEGLFFPDCPSSKFDKISKKKVK
jgi:hypothetical protein